MSRPGKHLFPEEGITKADLVDYYRTVAPRMLPHLRGRPLMLERHPDGIDAGGFMQKDLPEYFPDWVHHAELPKSDGRVTCVICDDTATPAYLASQACITPHRFLSRVDRPDHPDRLLFDLDPARDDFAPVRDAARQLRRLLEEVGLPSAVMTTGSRGLHVLVPLDRRAPFDDVRAFARDLAQLLASRHPDTLTTEARKKARRGRLHLDIQRNAYPDGRGALCRPRPSRRARRRTGHLGRRRVTGPHRGASTPRRRRRPAPGRPLARRPASRPLARPGPPTPRRPARLSGATWEMRAMTGAPQFLPSQALPDVPYADFARSVGLGGLRVEKPGDVRDAWEWALASDRPCVLDFLTDPAVPPIPPHASLDQIEAAAAAVLQGDSDRAAVLKQGFKAKVQEFLTPRKSPAGRRH